MEMIARLQLLGLLAGLSAGLLLFAAFITWANGRTVIEGDLMIQARSKRVMGRMDRGTEVFEAFRQPPTVARGATCRFPC